MWNVILTRFASSFILILLEHTNNKTHVIIFYTTFRAKRESERQQFAKKGALRSKKDQKIRPKREIARDKFAKKVALRSKKDQKISRPIGVVTYLACG